MSRHGGKDERAAAGVFVEMVKELVYILDNPVYLFCSGPR